MTKKRRFFSGSTLEAALVAAASEYGIPVEEIAYRQIEKKHGFVRVRRNVVIEVDPESPRRREGDEPVEVAPVPERRTPPPPPRQQETAEPAPPPPPPVPGTTAEAEPAEEAEEERPPAAREERGRERRRREVREEEPEATRRAAPPRRRREEPAEEPEEGITQEGAGEGAGDEGRRRERRRRHRARPTARPRDLRPIEERLPKAKGPEADAVGEGVDWVLDLVDLDVDSEIYQGDDRYEVELRGPDREVLIADEGKVLLALEHLLPRVLHGVVGETYACRIDTENFQEGREERLRRKALAVAEEVSESGRPEILEAMDPADRRIVHLALNDSEEVGTKSLGSGYFKRVKVYPL